MKPTGGQQERLVKHLQRLHRLLSRRPSLRVSAWGRVTIDGPQMVLTHSATLGHLNYPSGGGGGGVRSD